MKNLANGKLEAGIYGGEGCGGYSGWINPKRDSRHKVPAWMVFITTDGKVELGIRDNAKDELVF